MMGKNQCQSCGMPLKDDETLGTNKDGTLSNEYCKNCFKDGEFTQDITMEQMSELCLKRMKEIGMPGPIAKLMLKKGLPKLKRWKQN
ncbi:MAG: zinc ribbon domain-containing protein [Defluviitaleaceae bacterium]|nr:zinc ribbon domain-containing protein [Defluviitaleaceae bacterium]